MCVAVRWHVFYVTDKVLVATGRQSANHLLCSLCHSHFIIIVIIINCTVLPYSLCPSMLRWIAWIVCMFIFTRLKYSLPHCIIRYAIYHWVCCVHWLSVGQPIHITFNTLCCMYCSAIVLNLLLYFRCMVIAWAGWPDCMMLYFCSYSAEGLNWHCLVLYLQIFWWWSNPLFDCYLVNWLNKWLAW